jgi:hypothetical protein
MFGCEHHDLRNPIPPPAACFRRNFLRLSIVGSAGLAATSLTAVPTPTYAQSEVITLRFGAPTNAEAETKPMKLFADFASSATKIEKGASHD